MKELVDSDVKKQTTLDIWHWAMYHNEKNFRKPFEFHPERWMGDPEFANDSLDALKPFHIGPRNCLGMKYVVFPSSFSLPPVRSSTQTSSEKHADGTKTTASPTQRCA